MFQLLVFYNVIRVIISIMLVMLFSQFLYNFHDSFFSKTNLDLVILVLALHRASDCYPTHF